MTEYHIPALLEETVNGLNIQPDGIYVDATFGGGGHSREILAQLSSKGRLIAFDRDAEAQRNLPEDERITLIPYDFRYIRQFLRYLNAFPADGILADFGISFHQVDAGERGFSFRFDAALDMRMDQAQALTAAEVLNSYPESELVRIFSEYGEVPNSKRLASRIAMRRTMAPIETTNDLSRIAEEVLPGREVLKKYLAPVYQALRIEVNKEMEALEYFLEAALASLKPGGRLSLLSYHSLEDRRVKRFLASGNLDGTEDKDVFGRSTSPWKEITRKPIMPSEEEISRNPRSRSARLRIAEKVNIN